MRMIALAQAWQRRGGIAHLASLPLPSGLEQRLVSESIICHTLRHAPCGTPVGLVDDQDSTAQLATQLGSQWVVLDGYQFDSKYQTRLRGAGLNLAVVTDYRHCDHWDCDVLINPNPHASEEHEIDRSATRRCLLGTRFALLRNEFRVPVEIRPELEAEGASRLLITLGGSDRDNITGQILEKLAHIHTANLNVRVLVGAANSNLRLLEALASHSPFSCQLCVSVSDMRSQYEWADGIIGAGGSSCWEWLYLGLPGGVVAIAENQRDIFEALVQAGVATGLATSSSSRQIDPSRLQQFVESLQTSDKDPRRFRDWVDGFGAERIAAELDDGLWLRPATCSDQQLYFDWVNELDVRRNSLCSDPVPWNTHCQWYERQIAGHHTVMLVAIQREKAVGQIRFSQVDHDSTGTPIWQVSFSVDAESRGQGLGRKILILGLQQMIAQGHLVFTAVTKRGNVASSRCFQHLQWRCEPQASSSGDLELYHWDAR